MERQLQEKCEEAKMLADRVAVLEKDMASQVTAATEKMRADYEVQLRLQQGGYEQAQVENKVAKAKLKEKKLEVKELKNAIHMLQVQHDEKVAQLQVELQASGAAGDERAEQIALEVSREAVAAVQEKYEVAVADRNELIADLRAQVDKASNALKTSLQRLDDKRQDYAEELQLLEGELQAVTEEGEQWREKAEKAVVRAAHEAKRCAAAVAELQRMGVALPWCEE